MLYPNPTTGTFSVDLFLEKNTEVRLSLLDFQGREVAVFEEEMLAAGQQKLSFDLELPVGLYLVRMSVGGSVASQKLMIFK